MSSINLFSKIGIAIVTFNNEVEIKELLISLNSQTAWKNFLLNKIVIVDNNSFDNTVSQILKVKKILKNIKGKIIVKKNAKNYGFAKGVNQAISMLHSEEIIILINPDIKLKKNTLLNLVLCLRFADIVGGQLLKMQSISRTNKDKTHGTFVRKPTFWTAIFEFTNIKKLWKNNPFYRHFYYLNENNRLSPRYVDAVSGALMALSREVLKATGQFDENFFLYLEDVDFCIRAKEKGFRILFCPHATAWHYGGASSKEKRGNIRYDAWIYSRRYFFKKHLSALLFFVVNLLFYLDELIIKIKNFIFKCK